MRLALLGAALGSVLVLPATAQEPAARPASALTESEERALDQALGSAGLTRADLRFRKQVFPTRAALPAVQQALDDPLGARDRLFALAYETAPTAAWAAALADPARPYQTGDTSAQFAEVAVEAQLTRLRIASPFLTRKERRDIARLPAPILAMVGELARLLARPPEDPERSVTAQVAHALRAVRPNELPLIRSWGLRHTLAPDEAFDGFQPRRLAPAEGVLAAQSGFGDPRAAVLDALARVDRDAMAAAADRLWRFAARARFAARGAGTPPTQPDPLGLVSGGIVARITTRCGDLVIGGTGDNRYLHGAAQFIIDLGGDDTYAGSLGGADGRAGRAVALLVDCGGNDVYEAEEPCSFGGALLGVAVCADFGGDDRYRGTLVTQGAAVAGCGVLFDASGKDRYTGERFAQGAALGGVGLLRDDGAEGDSYRVVTFGQGFGRTAAVGVLADAGGNDTYTGGGEYPYLPQAPEHSYSHCQGYGIGVREQGFAGGVGMLIDRGGDDTYRASMHSQGGATWYALGVLADLGGNDTYAAVFNSQGAAVHIAAGMLLEGGGDDRYLLSGGSPAFDDAGGKAHERAGLGQGTAHDFAVGLLHDLGGNDRYEARAGAQGVGFTQGLGILIDRAGDDVYGGEEGHLQGAGRRNRQLPSLGVFVDAAGNDLYATGRTDGQTWTWSDIGVGCDLGAGKGAKPEKLAVPGSRGEKPLPPQALRPPPPEARLGEAEFRSLWKRATVWNIGDARKDVRQARDQLIAWGPRCLHLIEREMGAGGSWIGPVLWAIDDVLGGIAKAQPQAVEMLLRNVTSRENSQERVIGMMIGARLQMPVVKPAILADLEKPGIGRFAVTAAGQMRLPEALPAIRGLALSRDETEVAAALRAFAAYKGAPGLQEIRDGLSHRSFLVRDTAARALTAKKAIGLVTAKAVLADQAQPKIAKAWARFAIQILEKKPVRGGENLRSGLVVYPDYFGGG